jgi:hypothetical protein
MKRLLIFLTFLAVSGVAYAADPTTDLLEATFVKNFITLSVADNNGKPTVQYAIDGDKSSKTASGLTFRSNGEIAIRIQKLNPLTQTWTVEVNSTPDVSFAAIKSFLNDLEALQTALPQPPPPPSAGVAAQSKVVSDDCTTINTLLMGAYKALHDQELTTQKLQDVVLGATGRSGIKMASASLVGYQETVNNNITTAQADLAQIRTTYSALQNNPPAQCENITAQMLVDYVEVRGTADQIIGVKEALSKQLGDLVNTLQPYLTADQENNWQGDDYNDYVIKRVTPTFSDQQNVSATVKKRTEMLKDGSIVVTTDDANPITATFAVRKNSFFAAERAAAVIYNNLKYPQYGTATNAQGAMVVQRTMDHQPVNGALMLNLVMRLGTSASVAYPFLQFGVSSAKDFPGVLAGLGLRFAQPFNFSISAGGMITRYKDLDGNLKVGDTVTGTDDINKHLVYKTSPVVLYGAMQLKF